MERIMRVLMLLMVLVMPMLMTAQTVQLTAFDDANGNGTDDGDARIGGLAPSLTLYEDTNGNGTGEAGESLGSPTEISAGVYEWAVTVGVNNFIVGITDQSPTWYPTVHSPGADATDVDGDSDLDPASLQSHPFMVLPAETKINVDFGFLAPASIGDLVWEDMDGNGQQDGGDNGFDWGAAGITIDIMYAGGGAVTDLTGAPATATNLGGGNYVVGDLPPGDYELTFSQVVGAYYRTEALAAGAAVDSDPDKITGVTATITLVSGQIVDDVDAGYVQPSTISDFTWDDLNGNGIQDGGEPGLGGVDISITDDVGGAVTDLDGAIVGATTSDGAGMYMFERLAPGDYIVNFADESGMNYYRTVDNATGTPTDAGDTTDDSDADQATGDTHVITITSGEDQEDIDAGYYEPATIEGLVWHDSNGDGEYGGIDSPLAGFNVTLANGGGVAPVQDVNGVNVADQLSDAAGMVTFTDLAPGDYTLIFQPMAGYEFTYQDQSGAVDPDVDNDSDVPMGGGTQTSNPFSVQGSETHSLTGAGLFRRLSLGDFVWIESDNNGNQDVGEGGAVAVPLILYYDDNFDGTPNNPEATTNTDMSGNFFFQNLIPGNYQIYIENGQFGPGGALEFFQSCNGFGDPNDGNASDDNGDGDVLSGADVISGVIELYCLPGGLNQPGQDENFNVDFCFYFDCDNPGADLSYQNCAEADEADPICNLNVLDNYCGSMNTANSTGVQPSPLCPDGGAPHNSSWFSFVAGTNDFEIQVVPINCTTVGGFTGIQAGVYTDCTFSESVFCQSDCSTAPITVSGGLVPGEVYYFFLDGCAGSVCDFEVNVLQGGQAFPLPSPTGLICDVPDCGPVCPGSEVTFTVEGLNLEIDYTWNIPGDATLVSEGEQMGNIVTTTVNEITLSFDMAGIYDVTMNSATNGCTISAPAVTATVTVEDPDDEDFGEYIVCEHDFPFQITGDDPNGDGVSWQGGLITGPGMNITHNYVTPEGCMYDQIVDIVQIDNSPREEVNIALCPDELPFEYDDGALVVVGNEYSSGLLYTLQNTQAASGCDSFVDLTVVVLEVEGELEIGPCVEGGVELQFVDVQYNPPVPEMVTFTWTNSMNEVVTDTDGFDDILTVEESGEYTLTVDITHFGRTCTFTFGPEEIDIEAQVPPISTAEDWLLTPCGSSGTVFYTVSNEDETVIFYEWNIIGSGAIVGGFLSNTVEVDWSGGDGTLCVTAVNTCGEGETLCEDVVLTEAPEIEIDLIDEECQDTIVMIGFIGSVSSDAVFDWDFGNGQTATTEGPHDIVYTTPGRYYVTLQVDDNGCISDLVTDSIDIIERLPAPILSCESTPSSITIYWDPIPGATGYDVNLLAGEMGMVVDDTSYVATGVGVGDSVWLSVAAITDGACELGNPATFQCFAQDCDEPIFTFTPTRDTICLTSPVDVDTIYVDVSIAGGMGTFSGAGIVDADLGAFDAAVAGVGMHTITYSWVDADNCMFSRSILMHVFEQPIADFITDVDTICITDAFTVNYTGGTVGGTLTWDFGPDVVTPGTGEGPFDIQFNSAGAHTITLNIEKQECADGPFSKEVFVQDTLPALIIDCDTDATFVNYSWNDIADEYEVFIDNVSQGIQTGTTYDNTGLTPGTTVNIEVVALSTNRCPDQSATESCSANDCPGVSVDIFQMDSLICLNSLTTSIDLNFEVIGGFMDGSGVAVWGGTSVDTDSGLFDPVAAGEGVHTITLDYNEGDCMADQVSITYTIVEEPTADFDGVMTVCQGTEITLNHTGIGGAGAVYTWTTPGATVIGASDESSITLVYDVDGMYDITLDVSRNGCNATPVTQTITIDKMLDAPAIICADPNSESITFEWGAVDGAIEYEILIDNVSVGTQTATSYNIPGLSPGDMREITVIAISGNTCPNATSMRLCEAIDCPVTDVIPSIIDTVICEGSGVLLDLDYSVTGGFMDGSGMGTFNGTATDPTTGIVTTDNLSPGDYTVYIDYSEGPCDTRDSVLISIVDLPVPSLDLPTSVCLDEIFTVSYTGDALPTGATLSIISEGSPTSQGGTPTSEDYFYDVAGTYNFSVSIMVGDCEISSQDYPIVVQPEIVLTLGGNPTDCISNLPDMIQLTAEAANSDGTGIGTWSGDFVSADGMFDISASGTGSFVVDYSFVENGCTFDASTTVEIFDGPLLETTGTDASCFDSNDGTLDIVVSGGDGNLEVTVSAQLPEFPMTFAGDAMLTNLSPTTYTITVVDGNLCSSETTVNITAPSQPSFTVTGPPSIPVGMFGDLGLDLGTVSVDDIDNITWSDDTGILCDGPDCFDLVVSPSVNSTYCVDITLVGGCVVSDCIVVLSEFISVTTVSNVFSPNGDGSNETTVISSNNPELVANYFRIYDRWGNLVHAVEEDWLPFEDMNFASWDGTFKGKRLNPGVYVYVLEVRDGLDGVPEIIVGDITLVR